MDLSYIKENWEKLRIRLGDEILLEVEEPVPFVGNVKSVKLGRVVIMSDTFIKIESSSICEIDHTFYTFKYQEMADQIEKGRLIVLRKLAL